MPVGRYTHAKNARPDYSRLDYTQDTKSPDWIRLPDLGEQPPLSAPELPPLLPLTSDTLHKLAAQQQLCKMVAQPHAQLKHE